MKISIKNLNVDMELGNKAFELDIYNNAGNHLGDIGIGKATVEWCKGKTRAGNGVQKSWEDIIQFFEQPAQ